MTCGIRSTPCRGRPAHMPCVHLGQSDEPGQRTFQTLAFSATSCGLIRLRRLHGCVNRLICSFSVNPICHVFSFFSFFLLLLLIFFPWDSSKVFTKRKLIAGDGGMASVPSRHLCRLEATSGFGQNDRGVSVSFGTDVVNSFLQLHDLDLTPGGRPGRFFQGGG